MTKLYMPYDQAREYILDGDVLLFRGRMAVIARMIRVYTNSQYAHVGMAGWSNGGAEDPLSDLMVYEMLPGGGRGVKLSSRVRDLPGDIDVYRVADYHTNYTWNESGKLLAGETHVLDRRKAVSLMRDFCEPGNYGMKHLFWMAFSHLPVIRWFIKPPTDDALKSREMAPTCGEATSYSLRHGFTDVVRNTADCFTTPGDIARSPLLHYMFTLVPPEVEEPEESSLTEE